jgi:predicted phosphoribosyltransferase
VIAIPVASSQAKHLLEKEADDVVIIRSPSNFKTVQSYYQDFNPISDQELVRILKEMGIISQ